VREARRAAGSPVWYMRRIGRGLGRAIRYDRAGGRPALVATVMVAVMLGSSLTGCGDTTSAGGRPQHAPAKTASAPAKHRARTAKARALRRRHHRRHHHHARRARGTIARIAYVIDGDTIALTSGPHVRFLQIDTPELSGNECYATQARGLLESLLPAGARVTLRKDAALDTVDRYGRLLRYLPRHQARARRCGDAPAGTGLIRRRRVSGQELRAGVYAVSAGHERSGLWRHPGFREADPRDRLGSLPARRGWRRRRV
jgi:endonuclease YncB( thermonuclease family)